MSISSHGITSLLFRSKFFCVRASPPAYANGPHRVVWPASPATGDAATAKGCPFTPKTLLLPLPCSDLFFPPNSKDFGNLPGLTEITPTGYRNSSLQLAGHLFLGFGVGAGRSGWGSCRPPRPGPRFSTGRDPLAWLLVPAGGDALSPPNLEP